MQIEGDDYRHLRSEPAAQPRQKLALGVLMAVADHGAVEMEQYAVDRAFHVDGVEDHPGDRLEGVVGDDAGRVGVGGDRVNQVPAEFVGRLEGRAEGRAGAAERLGDLVFEMVITPADHRHIRRHPAESIRLVHETCGQNALQGITSSIAAE